MYYQWDNIRKIFYKCKYFLHVYYIFFNRLNGIGTFYEVINYIKTIFTGEKYWKDAVHALNVLGQVEALYESAANAGKPIHRNEFFVIPIQSRQSGNLKDCKKN
jgi:hypothetical protein